MSILIVNIGSTNLKYSSYIEQKSEQKKLIKQGESTNLKELIEVIKPRVIISRIVFYPNPQAIIELTPTIIKDLEQYNQYAPLHNPQVLESLQLINKNYPNIIQYICPDSSFHSSISLARSTYALPQNLNTQYSLRKYGFHGLSHQYLALEYQKLTGKKQARLITCHLGGGTSINATKNNKSLANSMGFSTEEGVMMVKRSGNISANLVLFLQEQLNFSTQDMRKLLTQESGFFGLTGTTDIKAIVESNEPNCKLAVEIYTNQIVDYIASYYNLLGGVESVIFSGGIGEKSKKIRETIRNKLKTLPLEYMVLKTDESQIMLDYYSDLKKKNNPTRSYFK